MRKNRNKSIFDKFPKIVLGIDDKKVLNVIFDSLLSDNEKLAISDRMIIFRELMNAKLTQKEISEKYNISLATISRGSKGLKNANKSTQKILEKHFAE